MAKKYADFKNDPSIRTPFFAWLLNNAFFYTAIFTVAILTIGAALYSGYQMYVKMLSIGSEPSEFLVVNKEKPESILWAEKVINTAPPGTEKWEVKPSSKPAHIIKFSNCNNVGYDLVKSSVLSTFSASGSGIKAGLQIIAPGQSLQNFNKYMEEVASCVNTDVVDYGELGVKTMLYNDNSFLMLAGDTLLNVEAKTSEQRPELLEFYYNLLTSTLTESNCYNLIVTDPDKNRDFYNNQENYLGLRESITVNTEVNITGLPTPTSLNINSIDLEKTYIEEPEAPLPKDFPTMPTEISKPIIPTLNTVDNAFSQDANYVIKDPIGPGCGWEWHGQAPPIFNDETLDEGKKLAIQDAQLTVNTNAENYIKNDIAWNLQMIKIYPKINDWNIYVSKVNQVYDKWAWLNTERANFAPLWYEYIGLYDYWKNFDVKKAAAEKAYEDATKICDEAIKELNDWVVEKDKLEKEYNENVIKYMEDYEKWKIEKAEWDKVKEENNGVNNNPKPVEPIAPELEIPDEPAGCPVPPEKPSIIDEVKPDEPVAPVPPEGVTIPNSWPKAE